MKTKIFYSLIMIFLIWTVLLPACKKKSSDDPAPASQGYTETIYSNPDDPQILSIDSAGRQAILMGTKGADGMPLTITQALVDAEDMNPNHRMLMEFNPDGTISQISNPELGIMTFTYVNATTWVIQMTLPDTLGTYQITFDPTSVKSTGDCGCGVKEPPVNAPMRSDVIRYLPGHEPTPPPAPLIVPSSPGDLAVDAVITATYKGDGGFVKGITMDGSYITNTGNKGGVLCTKGEFDGLWGYSMPDNPAPPPPAGFKAKAYALFNALCYGAIPIGLGRTAICSMFAPTGAGFAACHVIVTAYVWLCRANTVGKVGSYIYDIYSAETVTITLKAIHPSLPTQTKTVTFKPATPSLSNVDFMYDAYATFTDLHTEPAAPVAMSGYTIVATLSDAGVGEVTVRLSMVGTDGYTKTQDFQVSPGGSCMMGIPGAEEGVRDDITARINPGTTSLPGQVLHHYIVFQ